MKRFDSDAAYLRIKERLEMMSEWAQIAPNGTISNILKVFAEEENELARYLEFLYQEKKFKNARTLSAISSMTDLVGYKQQLPKSAIGYVIVSHTDKDGANRLENYGVDFFDLDAESDYDDLARKANASTEERAALVPWTANESYAIPAGTIFKSSDGTQFIATESVESRSLKEPYSSIKNDPVKYADFVSAGGWNGIKYLKVPVIQGIQRTKQIGQAEGTRFESFTLDTLDIENASNIISSNYFNITVEPYRKSSLTGEDESTGEVQTWEKIDNIRLAGPYDKVFETKILNDEGKLLIKFGDGITGQLLPENAILTVNYLETKGASGNVSAKFQVTSVQLQNESMQVDPRTNQVSNFICCTNISPIMGGKDIEAEEDLKENAPVSYLKSYTVSSKKSYMHQIEKNSPVNLLHLQMFTSEVVDSESYGTADNESEYVSSIDDTYNVLQEVTMAKNAILISALRSNGELIDDPENELLVPIRQALDDYMSPNDSLEFVQPNLIKLCPRVIVSTSSTMLESDIYSTLRPKIFSKMSVFNRDYGQTLYKSELVDLVHNESYCEAVDCFFEAKATVDMEPTILYTGASSGIGWLTDGVGNVVENVKSYTMDLDTETLFAFDFSFDKIYAQDSLSCGFKNYKVQSPYLLKVNIKLTDSPESSRTLFLFDNRVSLRDSITVNEAYEKTIDGTEKELKSVIYDGNEIKWQNAYDDGFQNYQSRTAQYTYIDKITSSSYMDQAKKFVNAPYEIRPVVVDENGKMKVMSTDEVDAVDALTMDMTTEEVVTPTCYKKNWQYWDHCKIELSEDYDDPSSDTYARGRVILPMNKILDETMRQSLEVLLGENAGDYDKQTPSIEKMIKDKVSIEVFAMPVQTTFKCGNKYDIISVDKDDIQIEKKQLISN